MEENECINRLRSLVENDRLGYIKNTLSVAESDVFELLCEFMDVKRLNMRVDTQEGGYRLMIDATIGEIFNVGKVIGQ